MSVDLILFYFIFSWYFLWSVPHALRWGSSDTGHLFHNFHMDAFQGFLLSHALGQFYFFNIQTYKAHLNQNHNLFLTLTKQHVVHIFI